jgi:hypothetical protein
MSNIIDIITKQQDAIGIIRLSDLMDFAQAIRREAIEDTRAQMATSSEADEPNDLLTINEAADILKVSRTTLHRYDKAGYLHPIKAGTAKRYRRADILNLTQGTR